MDPITLEQLTAAVKQASQDGFSMALATVAKPAAEVAKLEQARLGLSRDETLSPKVIEQINTLFLDERFRAALTEEAKKQKDAPLAQDDPAKTEDAEMGAGLAGTIGSLDNLGGFGIPLGSGTVGLFLGIATSKLVDGFVAPRNPDNSVNMVNPLVKVGAAWAAISFGSKFLGRPAALFIGGALAFDALRLVLPIDEWVQKLVDMVKGVGGGAAAQQNAYHQLAQYHAQQQYQLTEGHHGLPSTPLNQALPGFGGSDNLDSVFSPR